MATSGLSETPHQSKENSNEILQSNSNDPEGDSGNESQEIPEPSRKVKILTFVLLALSNFFYGANYSLYGPFFPQLAVVKEQPLSYVGLILSCHHLSTLIFTLIIGIWVQAVATKAILFIGLVTVGVSTVTFGSLEWSPHNTPFTALAFSLRFVDGFGAASIRASVHAISTSQFGKLWKAFVVLEIIFNLGLVVGPIAGGALKDYGGFKLPFFVFGASTVLIAVLVISAMPEPHVIKVKVTKTFLSVFKLAGNWIYFLAIFTTFYYAGFLETTLQPHLAQFQLQDMYIGLIFQTPAAVSTLMIYGWKYLLSKGLNSVMTIFVAAAVLITSMILVAPAKFTPLSSSIALVAIALVLKGIGDSAKSISTFHGAYSDSVWGGFGNDVHTHSLIFGLYVFGMMAGSVVGTSSAGYIYEGIGFESGILVPMVLEVITVPFILVYAFRRMYRKPLMYSAIGETEPLLQENAQ